MKRKSANSSSINNPRPLALSNAIGDSGPVGKGVTRCAHTTRNGRCRMPTTDSAVALCSEHARQQQKQQLVPDPEVLAAELLGEIENFATADAVNLFLGNLVKQLARKRIARRDAIALAYLCQLLLNSLTPLRREEEDEKDTAVGQELLNHIARAQAARLAGQQSSDTPEAQAIPSVHQ